MHRLILASQSPRRIEALRRLKIPFRSIPNSIDERTERDNLNTTPDEIALYLSEKKARSVSKEYPEQYVLGMDTIISYKDEIFGKPTTEKDAIRMLLVLNGEWHSVITGVTLINENLNYSDKRTVKSDVKFLHHPKEFIEKYVSLGESLDKAGGYGIQSGGRNLVENVNGDYSNVVGFPEETVISMLKNAGIYNQTTDDR